MSARSPAAQQRLEDRLALRPAEAARALGIGERTLRTLLPRLPHIRLDGAVLIPVRELERWLREQAAAQAAMREERVERVVREQLGEIAGAEGTRREP